MAVAYFGYSYNDFMDMSPRDFDEALVRRDKTRQFEYEFRRHQTSRLFDCNYDPKDRLKPEELIPLPWDKENLKKKMDKVEVFTDEEARKYDKIPVGNIK